MDEGEVLALRALVQGMVQAVGFRDFVYRRARLLGLAGYVCNGSDGRTVEVMAEGPREVLEQLLEHLWEGPRLARVDAVDVNWLEATGRLSDFTIRV
ncbi:MAG TPA: acylphosphatase [Dehalococcoidia bacterium]|nr:acylphosphatase [Dehalococcoidia bacterium]